MGDRCKHTSTRRRHQIGLEVEEESGVEGEDPGEERRDRIGVRIWVRSDSTR
jgi:hypothetical protein